MKSPSWKTAIPAILLLAQPGSTIDLNCKHARANGVSWDFSALGGPHYISWAHEHSPKIYNTTFTLDICNFLEKKGDKERQCPSGTHICGVDDIIKDDGTLEDGAVSTFAIAGEYGLSSGHHLDPKWSRFKGSDANSDSEKDGVRLKLNGRPYEGVEQSAVIEFNCIDKGSSAKLGMSKRADDEDGDEGDGDDDDDDDDHHSGGSHDNLDKDHPEWAAYRETDDGHGGTIKFQSFKMEEGTKLLRLNWDTHYACEGAIDEDDPDRDVKGGWGFFSWFFFLAFMGIIAYFAFFAWINYSRHGATGWDLLPHADTIRDIPYVLGDWGRKVIDTVQGSGSRGGYSAV